jgi:rRNA maturation endonuclease Nob1
VIERLIVKEKVYLGLSLYKCSACGVVSEVSAKPITSVQFCPLCGVSGLKRLNETNDVVIQKL